jgi:hypothetical protein
LPKYEYCRYRKILGNTSYTSIADTGRFWKILVIPVLQILEDSGKYWLYQYCRYWKIRYEVAECTCILVFFCPVCASVMRGRTVYRETGRKETRGGRKEKRGRTKREGGSQYSILRLIAMHNLACSYDISAVHNIRGKSPVMSKYFVWSLRV